MADAGAGAADPTPLLAYLEMAATDRKRRLYAAGCCRLLQGHGLLTDPLSAEALRATEEFADRRAPARQVKEVREQVARARPPGAEHTAAGYAAWALHRSLATRNHVSGLWVSQACRSAVTALARGTAEWGPEVHAAMQAAADQCQATLNAIVACVFGVPARHRSVCPDWQTTDVLALAGRIYGTRDFSLMPILADALQDAGCDNRDFLSHCRGDGPHVRGCWVVDLLTGRT